MGVQPVESPGSTKLYPLSCLLQCPQGAQLARVAPTDWHLLKKATLRARSAAVTSLLASLHGPPTALPAPASVGVRSPPSLVLRAPPPQVACRLAPRMWPQAGQCSKVSSLAHRSSRFLAYPVAPGAGQQARSSQLNNGCEIAGRRLPEPPQRRVKGMLSGFRLRSVPSSRDPAYQHWL